MTNAGRVHRSAARVIMGAPGLPMAWHRQTEDEVAAAHEWGYLCGLSAASAAMDRALHEAVAGVHYNAKQIVDSLIRAMDREIARSRHE
jgi:hypothetical protein